ncbi:MAG: 50S ribosomal protein L11 methyltransferase [Verrucomicrobia bacterium]|nr:50S ribosomal protein L11 methyltransferase [Verrucomicrobiota bacterium]
MSHRLSPALARLALAVFAFQVVRARAQEITPEERARIGYAGPVSWVTIEDLPRPLAQFETVFWDPRDTPSLRRLLRSSPVVKGKEVLEIGTGTGLLALCALTAGASRVVATDINPHAVKNATFNGARLALAPRLEVRQVTPERSAAFAVIRPDEQFDVILSNPPWVNRVPASIDEYALYDASFQLMRTLLDGLPRHLRPGGRVLLAYGCVDGIRTLRTECAKRGYEVRVIDDTRDLDRLPEEFLPGMLLEVVVPARKP